MVPLFAHGAGANAFYDLIDRQDTLYKSAYGLNDSWGTGVIDNTDVFLVARYGITGEVVPEPSTIAMLCVAGLAAGGFALRRYRRKTA